MVQQPFKSDRSEHKTSKFADHQSTDLIYINSTDALPLQSRQTSKQPLLNKIEPIADNLQTPVGGKLVRWWQGVHVRAKVTSLAVMMSTIPVLVIGRTAYYFADQSITQQVEAFGKAKVVDLQQKANLFMRQRFNDIQAMASLDVFTDPQLRSQATVEDQVATLTRLMNSYGIYDSIAIFDLQGNVVAQTAGPPLGNQLNQDYIQAALKNNGASISQPRLSESSKVYALYAASIIKDKTTDRPIGFIRARVPMEFLDEVLRNYGTQGTQYYLINTANEIFLGPEGSTEGTKVITFDAANPATTERREEYKKIIAEEVYPLFERIKAANQVSTIISYNSITRTEHLLTYSPSVQLRGLPNLNWQAIVSVDTETAFATQRQFLLTLSIGTAITALLVAAIAAMIANRATRPILAAATAVEKIGQGALGTRLRFQGTDEIASLASNINQMAQQLQESSGAQAFETAQERLLTAAKGSGALRTPDLQNIFDQTLEGTRNLLQLDRLVIYRFDAGSSGGIISESVAENWSSAFELNVNDSCIPQLVRDAYHQGRVLVADDISQAEFHPEHLKLLEQLQVKASLIIPILSGNEIFGLLIAHSCSSLRNWQQSEINFLKRLSNELGLSIYRVDLLERTIHLAEEQRQLKERLQKRALELLKEVDPISQGNLMIRAKVTDDEIGTIADVYNATVASLRKIVLQVQEATNQVVVTTDTNDTSIQSLSAEALRQAEEVTAALKLVTTMANAAREVAANAAQAEEAVKLADLTVAEGDAVMNQTVDGMQAIRVTVAEAAKKVKYLGESSQRISKAVELISAFAARTNILAINASVEASRAGSEGRGFSMIADEVRTLARQSAEATEEIRQLVLSIQAETREVITAMESGTEQVVTGTKLIDDTRQSLNKITAVSSEISQRVTTISQATISQSQTSEAVTRTMQDVALIANQTSAEANQVLSSFEQLRQVAQLLQESVGQFKVQ
ncbi:methyl-accepting chemotaxis protein [Pelatocladus sp. BLCC-F211]|uniref:methyl-accepting chemotaxis protein n=1 Tax=Pelatocladus sp. BLCC-F211 TaxID=3342752 RepID=UPI0035B9BA5B